MSQHFLRACCVHKLPFWKVMIIHHVQGHQRFNWQTRSVGTSTDKHGAWERQALTRSVGELTMHVVHTTISIRMFSIKSQCSFVWLFVRKTLCSTMPNSDDDSTVIDDDNGVKAEATSLLEPEDVRDVRFHPWFDLIHDGNIYVSDSSSSESRLTSCTKSPSAIFLWSCVLSVMPCSIPLSSSGANNRQRRQF